MKRLEVRAVRSPIADSHRSYGQHKSESCHPLAFHGHSIRDRQVNPKATTSEMTMPGLRLEDAVTYRIGDLVTSVPPELAVCHVMSLSFASSDLQKCDQFINLATGSFNVRTHQKPSPCSKASMLSVAARRLRQEWRSSSVGCVLTDSKRGLTSASVQISTQHFHAKMVSWFLEKITDATNDHCCYLRLLCS